MWLAWFAIILAIVLVLVNGLLTFWLVLAIRKVRCLMAIMNNMHCNVITDACMKNFTRLAAVYGPLRVTIEQKEED